LHKNRGEQKWEEVRRRRRRVRELGGVETRRNDAPFIFWYRKKAEYEEDLIAK
jgi:hypothetical protein